VLVHGGEVSAINPKHIAIIPTAGIWRRLLVPDGLPAPKGCFRQHDMGRFLDINDCMATWKNKDSHKGIKCSSTS
jgi:hypothetical protein